MPNSSTFLPDITITNDAPSLTCDDEAAVTDPLALKIVGNFPKISTVEFGRIPSSVSNISFVT